jgi:hypothetical protein
MRSRWESLRRISCQAEPDKFAQPLQAFNCVVYEKYHFFTILLYSLEIAERHSRGFATGDKPGIVIVELPAKPQWCEIRNTVFSWARTRFPFHPSSDKKLTLDQTPVVTVIGKAYFDVGHSLS